MPLTSITTGPIPEAPEKIMKIRESWANELNKIQTMINELDDPPTVDKEKNPKLLKMCRDRDVYELEVEGWSVTLAHKDPGRAKEYLDHLQEILNDHLKEIKKKIAASKDGSAHSDTTSTHS